MEAKATKAKWLRRFRSVSVAEGISFLLLLFVAMPLKYVMDIPLAVTYVGWVHGLLFVLYIYVTFPTARSLDWNFSKTFFALIAALLPFGPFVFDKNLSPEEKALVKT